MKGVMRVLVLAAVAVVGVAVRGGDSTPSAAEASALKAAYLYNFAKFVQWPARAYPRPDSPFVFCVYGADPMEEALIPLEDKQVSGRAVIVRGLRSGSQFSACHVLFVGSSRRLYARQIIEAAKDKPLLSVSDIPGFAADGGIIGLVPAGSKLRFEVNLVAAHSAGLTVSSLLLKLASSVIQEGKSP